MILPAWPYIHIWLFLLNFGASNEKKKFLFVLEMYKRGDFVKVCLKCQKRVVLDG